MEKFKKVAIVIVLFFTIGIFTGCQNEEDSINNIEKNSEYFIGNVFQIINQDLCKDPVSTGTGFVFNKYGWFITNAHVMEDAYFATGIFNIPNEKKGESFTYLDIDQAFYVDYDKDIFIGKMSNYYSISAYYKEFTFSTGYNQNETVYTVGYPNSSVNLEINKGKIIQDLSNLADKLFSGNTYIGFDAYIAPGSSGGILINQKNEVLGMTTRGYTINNKYICGAAISTFNFMNLIKISDSSKLQSLSSFLHSKEKKYINFFLSLQDKYNRFGEESGIIKIVEDNYVSYTFVEEEVGTNSQNESYVYQWSLSLSSNFFITYYSNIYWGDGQSREVLLYGDYSHTVGLKNAFFEMKYSYSNTSYFIVRCNDVNYNSNLNLTLNKLYLYKNVNVTVTTSDYEYVKEEFNSEYEWIISKINQY